VDLVLNILGLLIGALVGGWLPRRAWRVRQAVLRWLRAGVLALAKTRTESSCHLT